jgi:hypothetical protein
VFFSFFFGSKNTYNFKQFGLLVSLEASHEEVALMDEACTVSPVSSAVWLLHPFRIPRATSLELLFSSLTNIPVVHTSRGDLESLQ